MTTEPTNDDFSYEAPRLADYGPVSELTETIQGNTGDDGAGVPSSYTASI